jgi:CRISPR-associated protein Csy1
MTDVDPLFRQATELYRAGRLGEAEAMLRAVIGVAPDHAGALYRLGIIEHRRGQLEEAQALLTRASTADTREPVYPYTLGLVLHDLKDFGPAAASYREATKRRPDFAEAWNNMGLALQDGNNLGAASEALEQALRVRPGYEAAIRNLANVRNAQGVALANEDRIDEAIARYREAWRMRPQSLGAAIRAALTLPAVHRSADEIETARAGYARGLDELVAALPSFAGLDHRATLEGLTHTNFLLAYQGRDDRALQSRYGDFAAALLARTAPDWVRPLPRLAVVGRKIRVAFVSRLFFECTAGLYFKRWITELDRTRFEIIVHSLAPREDRVTAEIRAASDRFVLTAASVAVIAEMLREAAPDIIVYPELGMDAQTFALAALRLAPVQCAGFGHPVTTGLPTIDYFLSAAAIEPPNAQAQYRERLVLLDGLGTSYPRPNLPAPKSRAWLGLPEAGTLYLYPHSPFKIHPDSDALVARVLAADPAGTLVMFEGQNAAATRKVVERLRAAIGGDASRLVVLPVRSHDEYLRINLACDMLLDARHWSGGNTALDALACALPIIAWPGDTMRSRQTAAMLTLCGVPQLIARDAEDYVAIAARLAGDAAWRAEIKAVIAAGSDALFDRPEPIASFAQFLERAVGAS